MNDALIAIIIVIVAVIPVTATIQYAYSSILSSREMSDKFNEFGDKVDELIWNRVVSSDVDLSDVVSPLGAPVSSYSVTISNNESPPKTVQADMLTFENTLEAGRRKNPVKVYMIRRKP